MIDSKTEDPMECQRSICFVMKYHPDSLIGGAEIQSWLLARTLAQKGWRVHYVSEYDVPPPWGTLFDGVYIHGLKARPQLTRWGLDAMRCAALSRILARIDTEVYYQRVAGPYTGIVAHFAKSHHKKFLWAASQNLNCEKGTDRKSVV